MRETVGVSKGSQRARVPGMHQGLKGDSHIIIVENIIMIISIIVIIVIIIIIIFIMIMIIIIIVIFYPSIVQLCIVSSDRSSQYYVLLDRYEVAHCCAIFICYLVCEIYDTNTK